MAYNKLCKKRARCNGVVCYYRCELNLSGYEDAAQLKQIVTDVKVIDGVNKQKVWCI
jgi:hypothetical protein